jgi:hypothetical protein
MILTAIFLMVPLFNPPHPPATLGIFDCKNQGFRSANPDPVFSKKSQIERGMTLGRCPISTPIVTPYFNEQGVGLIKPISQPSFRLNRLPSSREFD